MATRVRKISKELRASLMSSIDKKVRTESKNGRILNSNLINKGQWYGCFIVYTLPQNNGEFLKRNLIVFALGKILRK